MASRKRLHKRILGLSEKISDLERDVDNYKDEIWSMENDSDDLERETSELKKKIEFIGDLSLDNFSHSDMQDVKELIIKFKKERFIL